MLRYVVKRIVLMFITVFIIFTALYFVEYIVMYKKFWPDYLSELLDNIVSRYFNYLKGIIKNRDFGKSFLTSELVWPKFKLRVRYTIIINLVALVFYSFIGVFLGVISAIKRNKYTDNIIGVLTNIFATCHPIILTFALMLILGYTLHLVPTTFPYNITSLKTGITAFIIPVLSLSLQPIAKIITVTRGELIEALNQEYILTARIKGLKKRYIIIRHGLRNCAYAIIPCITSTFMYTMFNCFFVERFYNIPGVAAWFLDSVISDAELYKYIYLDIPVTLIVALFFTLLGLSIALILDIIYKFLDPRVKIGSKKLEGIQ